MISVVVINKKQLEFRIIVDCTNKNEVTTWVY